MPAYAHNDYANARPLVDAIALGMRGVEADLLLVGGVLRVEHDRRAARRAPAFDSMYLVPIARVLSRCERITPAQPLLLTVELKSPHPAAFDTLVALLARALVSVDYGKTIGRIRRTAAGRRRWWAALRRIRAEVPGVLVRAHNVPVDAAVYRRLREAGVDLIGTKDPAATAALLRDSLR